jgi:hypothetical protein
LGRTSLAGTDLPDAEQGLPLHAPGSPRHSPARSRRLGCFLGHPEARLALPGRRVACYAASSHGASAGPASLRGEDYLPAHPPRPIPSTPSTARKTGGRTRSWASLPAPCTSGLVPTLSWG